MRIEKITLTALSAFGVLATSLTASAQAAPVRLDEGYTTFELNDHEESDNGARVFRGYHVTTHYRVFGTAPSGSAMLTIFRDGTREVGRVRCEGSNHRDTSDDPAWVGQTFECSDWEQRITTVGTLTAETRFVDGQTDAETVLRTHTLEVHEVSQAGASPTHYVSRHQEVLSGILAFTPRSPNNYPLHGYFTGYDPPSNVPSMVLILPIGGGSEAADGLTHTRLRCTANGQPVQLTAGDEPTETRGSRSVNLLQMVPTAGGGSEQHNLDFRQVVIGLPFTFGPDAEPDTVSVSRTPGRWQCDLRNNGTTVRTFAFTVAADGTFAPHEEQTSGGLYLGPRAVLVDVTVPAAGARSESTAPTEVRAGGFHGRPWTTDTLRAAAQAVPALGTPHLTPPAPARAAAGRPAAGGRRPRR